MSTASRFRCFLLACAAAASFATVPVEAHAWPALRFESAPCPAAVSESIAAAALSGVQCGHVEVPEHYFRAHAKRLRVFVTIIKTAAQNPGTPVLIVTGGPGQALSAISGQVFGTGVMNRVRADRDIVLIDPRGAGFSEPRLRCPPPAPPQPSTGTLSPQQQDAVRCAEALSAQGIDLSAYGTPNLARDLWSVRTALGLPKVILYAVSYGGFLGLQALRGAEHWIESAVLLSMPQPQGGSVLYSADTAQGALENYNAQCAAQPACVAYGDFRSNLNELFGRLRAQPLELQLPSPDGQSSSAFQVTGDVLGVLFRIAIGGPATAAGFPKAIASALQGDNALLVPYAQLMAAPQPPVDFDLVASLPLHNSIWCSEELTIGSPEELDQRAAGTDPIIQQTFVQGLRSEYEVCEVWPVPEASPLLYSPVISRVPTYIIGGALDPATAGDAGVRALRFLPNGHLSIIAAAGHLAAEQVACAPEIVAQFMAAPYARVNDTCLAQPVPFVD